MAGEAQGQLPANLHLERGPQGIRRVARREHEHVARRSGVPKFQDGAPNVAVELDARQHSADCQVFGARRKADVSDITSVMWYAKPKERITQRRPGASGSRLNRTTGNIYVMEIPESVIAMVERDVTTVLGGTVQ